MNHKQTIASLKKIANELDNIGLYKEANITTNVMRRLADEFNISDTPDEVTPTQPSQPMKQTPLAPSQSDDEAKRQSILDKVLQIKIYKFEVPEIRGVYFDNTDSLTLKQIINMMINRCYSFFYRELYDNQTNPEYLTESNIVNEILKFKNEKKKETLSSEWYRGNFYGLDDD